MISKRLFGYSMLECTEDHKFLLFDFSSCFPFCFDCYEPRVRARVCVRGAGDGDVLVLPSGEVQEVQDTQKSENTNRRLRILQNNFHKITCTMDFRILAHQAVAITECWACGASDMPHSKNVCPTGVRIWPLNGMFSSCCQVEVLDMIYSLMRILIPSYIFLKFDRYRLIVCICSGIFFLRRLQRISGSHGHGRTDSIKLERLCSYLHYIFVHIFSL